MPRQTRDFEKHTLWSVFYRLDSDLFPEETVNLSQVSPEMPTAGTGFLDWGGRSARIAALEPDRLDSGQSGMGPAIDSTALKAGVTVRLSNSVSGALRTFAYFMSSGTHYMLEGIDCVSLYGSEPSAIERAYAIFANVLELDENGLVLNAQYAQRRATDYIRSYSDPTFSVDPPYEDWEIELYDPPPLNDLI